MWGTVPKKFLEKLDGLLRMGSAMLRISLAAHGPAACQCEPFAKADIARTKSGSSSSLPIQRILILLGTC